MLIAAIVYLSWDVYFTEHGYWGFNDRYLAGLEFLGLPVEEWLFFICIPYACAFTHYTLVSIYPNLKLSDPITQWIATILGLLLIIIGLLNFGRAYTFTNFLLCFVILSLTFIFARYILKTFFLTFLVMLIPFFIVNGILTGSWIPEEVVWYSDLENLGIRMGTIPVEDSMYAFGLILLGIFLTEVFRGRPGMGQ